MSGATQSPARVPSNGTSLERGAGDPSGGNAILDRWSFAGRRAGDLSALRGMKLAGRTSCACVERSSRRMEGNVSRT